MRRVAANPLSLPGSWMSPATGVEYAALVGLTEIFPVHSLGIETGRDHFAVAFEPETLVGRIDALRSGVDDDTLRARYRLADARDWTLAAARAALRECRDPGTLVRRVLYRPFDFRPMILSPAVVTWPRRRVLGHLGGGPIALVCARTCRAGEGGGVFCADRPVDKGALSSRDNASVFPLHVPAGHSPRGALSGDDPPPLRANLSHDLAARFSRDAAAPRRGRGARSGFAPEDLFGCIYAILHSGGYRRRYAAFLAEDYPRVPIPSDPGLFRGLSRLGGELVGLHVMDAPALDWVSTRVVGAIDRPVEKVGWSDDTVWIDPGRRAGFEGISHAMWGYHVGGHRVCSKWLRDRIGRVLDAGELRHYQRIAAAIAETLRLCGEVDRVIESFGGWPIR